MRAFRVYGFLLLASLLAASLCGCAKEGEESGPEGQDSAASTDEVSSEDDAQGVRFGDMLASWESGRKEDAVEQLLSIRWVEPALFADVPHLSLSEDEFKALSLSGDERTRRQEEYMELVSTFKNLSRHCCSVGENALATGDKETAKAHYEAVLHLGEALSSPKRVSMMQGTGKALMRMAEEKLSALK